MIRVCEHCSNVKIDELKDTFGEEAVIVDCIENCAAYAEKPFGFINDELVVEENFEDWMQKAKTLLDHK